MDYNSIKIGDMVIVNEPISGMKRIACVLNTEENHNETGMYTLDIPSMDKGSSVYEVRFIDDGSTERIYEGSDTIEIFTSDYFIEAGNVRIFTKRKDLWMIISVGSDEGEIAHFHIYENEEDRKLWKNGACLMYKENRYYDHGRNKRILNKDDFNGVIDKLEKLQVKENGTKETVWKFLVDRWNFSNSLFPIDPDLEMPPYDFKTIKRYKEK